MTSQQIVRAWKDADYSAELAMDEGATMPPSPVGSIELSDDALGAIAGGNPQGGTQYLESLGCCKGFTQAGACDITLVIVTPYWTTFCPTIFMTGGC